ncbi:MAG: hypothetical protein KDA52_20495 [Planctomycetaceae bacterium]|nr:hypothetical protein [Planctomycetaceae bacterium]
MATKHSEGSRKIDRGDRGRELVAALKELADAEGPNVSLRRLIKFLGRSEPYVMAYFDTWGDLREAAGLPRRRQRGYSPKMLLDKLRKVEAEHSSTVSKRRFYHLTGISENACIRLFGSWREFREAAGLHEMASPGTPVRYTRELLLKLMQEQLPILGRRMTRNQFAKAVNISTATIDRLGNWGALRSELNLNARGRAKTKSFAQKLGIELFDEEPSLFDFSDPALDMLR